MFISRVRRSILSLILVGALLAVPGGLASATTSDLATLLVLAGTVTVNGTALPMPADGQTVRMGDEIWTGPDGIALITFFDGTETQLQADTHITLEAPADGSGVSVFQSAGTTVNHVHHLAPNASFQTDTPTAVAMVRGTTYVVTTTPASDVVESPGTAETDTAAAAATDPADGPDQSAKSDDVPPSDVSPSTEMTSLDPMQADDQAFQQAALVSAVPLFDPAQASPATLCERGKPSTCATSVVLLADADGHVGHVEVASHVVGHPPLHLTAHGDAAHVSIAGATRQIIKADHLAMLHEAARHLRDVQRARQAQMAARHIVRQVHRPAHPVSAKPRP